MRVHWGDLRWHEVAGGGDVLELLLFFAALVAVAAFVGAL